MGGPAADNLEESELKPSETWTAEVLYAELAAAKKVESDGKMNKMEEVRGKKGS